MIPETLQTPTSLVVLAGCPSCGLRQPLRVYLNAELVVSDEGSVLALKAKASKAEHLCGQMSLEDAERSIIQPMLDLAEKYSVTIESKGRSVTLSGPAYTTLVAEGETLDQALVRVEKRPDHQDVIGSEAGQALLEAIKLEGGGFVPFLTSEQLAGEQVPA